MSDCGAIPKNLIDYALWGQGADGSLARQAAALGAALDAFRSSQPDPRYISSIPPLDLLVSEYARLAAAIDDWVGRVGVAFQQAGQAEESLSARRGAPYDVLTSRISASAGLITALTRSAEGALRADAAALVMGAKSVAAGFIADQRASTSPDLAARVNTWWHGLEPYVQQQLITSDPAVIGWLDGLPATVRDLANRVTLTAEIQRLSKEQARLEQEIKTPTWSPQLTMHLSVPPAPGSVSPEQVAAWEQELGRVDGLLQGLMAVQTGIGRPGTGRHGLPPAYLLGVDTTDLGHVIVAFGNPDTARNVVTYVPGLGTTLAGASGDMTRAARLWTAVHAIDGSHPTASIYWLGYNAPQLSELFSSESVVLPNQANQGAPVLDSFAAGLRAAHLPSFTAHTVMLGHSYGSLVVGTAAERAADLAMGRLSDDLILVGSPGVGVYKASQLGYDPSHVWVGAASNDFVAGSGWFTMDPALAPFGARDFTVADGALWPFLHAHSQYWDEGSVCLRNMAYIVAGMYSSVSLSPYPPTGPPPR